MFVSVCKYHYRQITQKETKLNSYVIENDNSYLHMTLLVGAINRVKTIHLPDVVKPVMDITITPSPEDLGE